MSPTDWRAGAGGALGARLPASTGALLVLMNGGETEVLFQLPAPPPRARWRRLLSTAEPAATRRRLRRGSLRLLPHTLVLLDQEAVEASSPAASKTNS